MSEEIVKKDEKIVEKDEKKVEIKAKPAKIKEKKLYSDEELLEFQNKIARIMGNKQQVNSLIVTIYSEKPLPDFLHIPGNPYYFPRGKAYLQELGVISWRDDENTKNVVVKEVSNTQGYESQCVFSLLNNGELLIDEKDDSEGLIVKTDQLSDKEINIGDKSHFAWLFRNKPVLIKSNDRNVVSTV